jgi:hypothetical protein
LATCVRADVKRNAARQGGFQVRSSTLDDLTKSETALIASGLVVAAVLVALGTWYLIASFLPSDPNDPLTKVGGLKTKQSVQRE